MIALNLALLFLFLFCFAFKFLKTLMSPFPTRQALQSWTKRQLKSFLTTNSETVLSSSNKEQLINKVLEIQLREHLVDSSINLSATNNDNTPQEERYTLTKKQLKSLFRQVMEESIQLQVVRNQQHTETQAQSETQALPTSRIQLQEDARIEEQNRIQDFLISQITKANNNNDLPVSRIISKLKNGL